MDFCRITIAIEYACGLCELTDILEFVFGSV
jgi:hypothetical protein